LLMEELNIASSALVSFFPSLFSCWTSRVSHSVPNKLRSLNIFFFNHLLLNNDLNYGLLMILKNLNKECPEFQMSFRYKENRASWACLVAVEKSYRKAVINMASSVLVTVQGHSSEWNELPLRKRSLITGNDKRWTF
jgi:hypothetical protein